MALEINELNFDNINEVKEAAEVLRLAFSQPPWRWRAKPAHYVTRISNYRTLIEQNGGLALVAKFKGKIVGMSIGHVYSPGCKTRKIEEKLGTGKHYLAPDLAVHPDFQRRGIADKLAQRQLSAATALKCKKIFASTNCENTRQIALFKKYRFNEFHQQRQKDRRVSWFAKQLE
ncbi:MAG: GNAT family N-acetyltransferase [Candidatus Micrarchaeota archaeon]